MVKKLVCQQQQHFSAHVSKHSFCQIKRTVKQCSAYICRVKIKVMIVRFALIFLAVFDFTCDAYSKTKALTRRVHHGLVHLLAEKSTSTSSAA